MKTNCPTCRGHGATTRTHKARIETETGKRETVSMAQTVICPACKGSGRAPFPGQKKEK